MEALHSNRHLPRNNQYIYMSVTLFRHGRAGLTYTVLALRGRNMLKVFQML